MRKREGEEEERKKGRKNERTKKEELCNHEAKQSTAHSHQAPAQERK